MTDENRRQRVTEAEWLRRAADVAETLTDKEIASLGQRVRRTTGEWLRHVATTHVESENAVNLDAARWVMRLLLEEREFTLQSIQLGPREPSSE